MGRHSRTKGAAFEREVAAILSEQLGRKVERRLGQARDGGCDLIGTEPWVIECKRRKTLGTVEAWLQQAIDAADGRPCAVIARSDGGKPFAIVPLPHFLTCMDLDLSTLR